MPSTPLQKVYYFFLHCPGGKHSVGVGGGGEVLVGAGVFVGIGGLVGAMVTEGTMVLVAIGVLSDPEVLVG